MLGNSFRDFARAALVGDRVMYRFDTDVPYPVREVTRFVLLINGQVCDELFVVDLTPEQEKRIVAGARDAQRQADAQYTHKLDLCFWSVTSTKVRTASFF